MDYKKPKYKIGDVVVVDVSFRNVKDYIQGEIVGAFLYGIEWDYAISYGEESCEITESQIIEKL